MPLPNSNLSRGRRKSALVFAVVILLAWGLFIYLTKGSGTATTKVKSRVSVLEDAFQEFSEYFNDHSLLRNDDTLPPLPADYVPIAMYVYKRADVLAQSLQHLRAATDIEKTVLIISQDGFVPEVAKVIDTIDFVRVKYVVHPIAPKERGTIMTLKNHWWWFMDKVWNEMTDLMPGDGHILFLEEDHAVSPDFYVTLLSMIRLKQQEARPDVWGVSLNRYDSAESQPNGFDFMGGHSNTAYSFNRTVWELIEQRRTYFMSFRDGWDWALYSLMQRGYVPGVHLAPRLSRVRNIGAEGITMNAEMYERAGFAVVPVSTQTHASETWVLGPETLGALPTALPLYNPLTAPS